jgi:amidohydrolase
MAAEDMSYFLNAVPGTFFFVGSANSDRGLDYPHHHPRFDFDEAVIPLAVDLMASAVASYVLPE